MKKFILIFFLLLTSSVFAEEKSCLTDHKISTKLCSTEQIDIFNKIIVPWLQFKFKEDLSDENCTRERKLIFKELFRVENIKDQVLDSNEDQNRFYVHIEFTYIVKDKTSDIKIYSVNGQEIVFWLEGGEIKDYMPFDDYVIKQEIEGDNYETEELRPQFTY